MRSEFRNIWIILTWLFVVKTPSQTQGLQFDKVNVNNCPWADKGDCSGNFPELKNIHGTWSTAICGGEDTALVHADFLANELEQDIFQGEQGHCYALLPYYDTFVFQVEHHSKTVSLQFNFYKAKWVGQDFQKTYVKTESYTVGRGNPSPIIYFQTTPGYDRFAIDMVCKTSGGCGGLDPASTTYQHNLRFYYTVMRFQPNSCDSYGSTNTCTYSDFDVVRRCVGSPMCNYPQQFSTTACCPDTGVFYANTNTCDTYQVCTDPASTPRPTLQPTRYPTTKSPSFAPTTETPSQAPTLRPTTLSPTPRPSFAPTTTPIPSEFLGSDLSYMVFGAGGVVILISLWCIKCHRDADIYNTKLASEELFASQSNNVAPTMMETKV